MLWLYLLGALTLLVISRRRLRLRIVPLNDELFSSKVAIEHVHNGVGWIREDGKIGSVNQSLADSLGTKLTEMVDHEWYLIFPRHERNRVKDSYTQMILAGIASLDTLIERADGVVKPVNLRLVAVHDHKMRLIGHHCIIEDLSRERDLEEQVRNLSSALQAYEERPSESVEAGEWADSNVP